jgi:hypothetical protein
MKLDVERLLNWFMVVLLTLRAECSLVTCKPAHLSPYLPRGHAGEILKIIKSEFIGSTAVE